MVARNLDAERSWRGNKGRGEQDRVGKGGGGGSGYLIEEGRGWVGVRRNNPGSGTTAMDTKYQT